MTPRRAFLLIHLALILLGVAYLVLSLTVGSTPDANIGAGLALLWLSALGLPWSLPFVLADPGGLWVQGALLAGAAPINLLAHAWWTLRRSTPE